MVTSSDADASEEIVSQCPKESLAVQLHTESRCAANQRHNDDEEYLEQ
jgi:hypothetical protein